jgi:hypothetical protein
MEAFIEPVIELVYENTVHQKLYIVDTDISVGFISYHIEIEYNKSSEESLNYKDQLDIALSESQSGDERASWPYTTAKATLINMFVNEEYRNRGYAKYMLMNFLFDVYLTGTNHTTNRYIIELDDMSDRAHSGSIYSKFGFEYITEDHPEMIMDKTLDELEELLEKHNIYYFDRINRDVFMEYCN